MPYRQNKHVRFGQQEGRCNGCRSEFPFRFLEDDHVIPQRAGSQDNIENLQLLCAHCNRVKGDRPQEYLDGKVAGTVDCGVHRATFLEANVKLTACLRRWRSGRSSRLCRFLGVVHVPRIQPCYRKVTR